MLRRKLPVRWACGVTTVAGREGLLERTLASLRLGGFEPRVYAEDGLRAYGTWLRALADLVLRSPTADVYAVFQDDLVCVRNLREHLERSDYPPRGYWNLHTFPENEGPPGWSVARGNGRSALALAFSREAAYALLSSKHTWARTVDPVKGHKSVDGAVHVSMRHAGWAEHVHTPSLTLHTGDVSTLGNPRYPPARTFPGESFDPVRGS